MITKPQSGGTNSTYSKYLLSIEWIHYPIKMKITVQVSLLRLFATVGMGTDPVTWRIAHRHT